MDYLGPNVDAVGTEEKIILDEFMRIMCYNVSIYDDERLESDEFLGLMLGVAEENKIETHVDNTHGEVLILIVDNDS